MPKTPSPVSPADARRIQVRRSGIHGKGLYALRNIAAAETVIEYRGEVISWSAAQARHPHNPDDPNHTFFFHIDDNRVIDGGVRGNASRWINHSCYGNCEAVEQEGRIFIKAVRDIRAGEELLYDYGLIIDARYTPALKAQYPCRCGASACRGTLLAPKGPRRRPRAGANPKPTGR